MFTPLFSFLDVVVDDDDDDTEGVNASHGGYTAETKVEPMSLFASKD